MKKKNLNLFNIRLTISDLIFLYKQISLKKSLMRATHNLYLKKSINVKGNIADLGAGKIMLIMNILMQIKRNWIVMIFIKLIVDQIFYHFVI